MHSNMISVHDAAGSECGKPAAMTPISCSCACLSQTLARTADTSGRHLLGSGSLTAFSMSRVLEDELSEPASCPPSTPFAHWRRRHSDLPWPQSGVSGTGTLFPVRTTSEQQHEDTTSRGPADRMRWAGTMMSAGSSMAPALEARNRMSPIWHGPHSKLEAWQVGQCPDLQTLHASIKPFQQQEGVYAAYNPVRRAHAALAVGTLCIRPAAHPAQHSARECQHVRQAPMRSAVMVRRQR